MTNSYVIFSVIVTAAVLVAIVGSIAIWGADKKRADNLANRPAPTPRR